MEDTIDRNKGLKLMVKKCRHEFRRTENTEFYEDDDYRVAERKYVKYCLFDLAD
jgi:hypothetical protein